MSSAAELLRPLVARGVNLSLEAMTAALRASGDPQRAVPCVHIAGTNGKGSVSAMTHAALRASGIRAALYTSPHLHRVAERFVIDDAPVSESRLCAEIERVRAEREGGLLPPLSFFEVLTLIAWRLFAEAGVEIAVMEVGVGGRLDATNVCVPKACAITRIALDHMAWLGPDEPSIAREKAGILKGDVPCVLGPALRAGAARAAIDEIAARVGAPCFEAPTHHVETDGTLAWPLGGGAVLRARPALGGGYQAENASIAVGLGLALGLAPQHIAAGLARARWPARMERVGDLLLDAAHNPDGLAALRVALGDESVGAVVFGASRDKDLPAMAARLAELAPPGAVFVTAAALERATPPNELAALTGGRACATPAEALTAARARAAGRTVVVCGSIFLVAAVRAEALGIENEPPVAM